MKGALKRLLPLVLAALAQCTQAVGSMLLILLASRTMDLASVGVLSLLYGFFVLGAGLLTGFVGDSLTVLDRSVRSTRAALQMWFLLLSGAVSVLTAAAGFLTGFTDGGLSVILGLAGLAFVTEEIVRRMLMTTLKFGRVTIVDLSVIAGMGVLLLGASRDGFQLDDFLLASLAGQTTGAAVGILLMPRSERYVVSMGKSALGQVARFGIWRAAQQGLRPALLAGIRFAVVFFISMAAAGELEVARIYAAPALLLVGGFASFLLPSYARDSSKPLKELVQRADRAVLALTAFTVLGSIPALLLLPVAGPLLTGRMPDPVAVTGWLLLSLGIGASIPYGSLAAVRGKAATVFGVRLGETLLSLALATAAIALSNSFVLAPLCAAAGSLMGAVVLRVFVLKRHIVRSSTEASEPGKRKSEAHV
jgi:O-antigen/teichoic acid export membrane protein